MPYCVVSGGSVSAAGGDGHEDVRIFYQRYGHGATKVLLIIGMPPLARFVDPFQDPYFLYRRNVRLLASGLLGAAAMSI